MTQSAIGTFDTAGLQIAPVEEGSSLRLVWKGQVTMRDPEQVIGPYLQDVVTASNSQRGVTIDLSAMEFMNSASLIPIVECLRTLREKKVPAKVWYNNTSSWQRVGCSSMRVLAQKIGGVLVEFAPKR